MKRYAEADDLIERALPAANDDAQRADFYRNKGLILERSIGPKAAFPWFDEATKLVPDPRALSGLAFSAWQLGRHARAIKLAGQALSLGPHDPFVIRRCCRVLASGGKNDEARSHLVKMSKLEYDIPHAHAAIAEGLLAVGDNRKALALGRRVARENPESIEVACTISQLLLTENKTTEARRLLRRLEKLDPAGHGKYALMGLANLASVEGKTDEMLEHTVEANRLYDDEQTRSLLRKVVRGVTADMQERETRLLDARAEAEKLRQEHEAFKASMAGFDPTEQGCNLAYALTEGEGWHIEFTERMPDQARDLAKEIAALSSQESGGTIFIGIRKDGTVVGVANVGNESQRDDWRKRVRNIATGIVNPPKPVTVYFNDVDGKAVVKVWVPEGTAPLYYVGGSPYIRNLDESRKATPEEAEEYMTRRSKKPA